MSEYWTEKDVMENAILDLQHERDDLQADLARRDASLLTEGEQKEILSYIRGNYDRDKIPSWLLDLIDEIDRLTAELAELRERFEVTDDLLNQATVTIGAVIACCTYNSNEDAKIGIYGISPDAFTRIDQFITNYNRAVSAGKVSVDVKTSTDNNKGE